jgi:hypothetical protein
MNLCLPKASRLFTKKKGLKMNRKDVLPAEKRKSSKEEKADMAAAADGAADTAAAADGAAADIAPRAREAGK